MIGLGFAQWVASRALRRRDLATYDRMAAVLERGFERFAAETGCQPRCAVCDDVNVNPRHDRCAACRATCRVAT